MKKGNVREIEGRGGGGEGGAVLIL